MSGLGSAGHFIGQYSNICWGVFVIFKNAHFPLETKQTKVKENNNRKSTTPILVSSSESKNIWQSDTCFKALKFKWLIPENFLCSAIPPLFLTGLSTSSVSVCLVWLRLGMSCMLSWWNQLEEARQQLGFLNIYDLITRSAGRESTCYRILNVLGPFRLKIVFLLQHRLIPCDGLCPDYCMAHSELSCTSYAIVGTPHSILPSS